MIYRIYFLENSGSVTAWDRSRIGYRRPEHFQVFAELNSVVPEINSGFLRNIPQPLADWLPTVVAGS
jgi:hypothetical protein